MESRTNQLRMWGVLGLFLALAVVALSSLARPYATSIVVTPPSPTTLDPISITVSGQWSDSCIPRSPMVTIVGSLITIATSHPGAICAMVITPYSFTVPIGRLPAGTYWVQVTYRGPNYTGLVGQALFVVRDVAPLTTGICDPRGPYPFLEDGARYYVSGGDNPNPGVDHWFDLAAAHPNFLSWWQGAGMTTHPFGIELRHNGDWVIYGRGTHPMVYPPPLTAIDLCLNTTGPTSVEVEIFVSDKGPWELTIPPIGGDIRNAAGWSRLGTVTVTPGGYRIYTITIPLPGVAGLNEAYYGLAVRLTTTGAAGENVLIAWLKLRR